jgi:phosphatidate cytidylyltransferase
LIAPDKEAFAKRDFMAADIVCLGMLLLMIIYRICKAELTKETVLGAFISLGAYLYICWPLSLGARLFYLGGHDEMWSRSLVLFVLVVVRLGDTGGYAIGCSTAKLLPGGNHKIAPLLSPKKSWEGLFGSMLFSSLAAAGLWFWLAPQLSSANRLPGFTLPVAVGFAIVSALVGFMGDLAESALKRVADVKDSGRVPGLGGLLDLMDSVLVNIPVFFFLLILLGLFC